MNKFIFIALTITAVLFGNEFFTSSNCTVAKANNAAKSSSCSQSTNVVYNRQKSPNSYFYSNSKKVYIKNVEGKNVMLWLFSTWCPSCISGFNALAEKQPELKKNNLTIIVLRNYKNGGYPGPTVTEFAKKYNEKLLSVKNWVFGEASEDLEQKYNEKKYPDIYYLIDEKGIIKEVNGAPAATLNNILSFAGGR